MSSNRNIPAPPALVSIEPIAPSNELKVEPEVKKDEKKSAEVKKAGSKINSPREKFEKLKASLPEGKPINVIATADGFYQRSRRKKGDKFTITCKEEFGTWMTPI